MALQFCDGFDHYATAELNEKYGSYSYASIVTPGRLGSAQCLKTTGPAGENVVRSSPSNSGELIAGVAFNLATLPTSSPGPAVIAFYDNGLSTLEEQCCVCVEPSGAVSIYTFPGNTKTLQAISANGLVSSGTWAYIELKVLFSTAAT